MCFKNSQNGLNAFQKNEISEMHFGSTTGYGYSDIGRDTIEKVFAEVLGAEDSLVRSQFISGTHALTVTLFALLRPGDTLLSITGKPYDTLDEVIGIEDNPSSLKSYNINFEKIDLIDDEFDYKQIEEKLKQQKIKVIETKFYNHLILFFQAEFVHFYLLNLSILCFSLCWRHLCCGGNCVIII